MKQEIKDYECPYCHEHFIMKRGGFSNHMRYCKDNPKYEDNILKEKKRFEEKHKQYLQYIENNKKEYKFICKECGKQYILNLTDKQFEEGKYSKFCSRSCANTRHHSDETKQKIKESLNNYNSEKRKQYLEKIHICALKKNKKIKQNIYKKVKKYFCGSKELDEQNYDISRRQSPKWFNKLIPFGFDITSLYTERIIQEHQKVKELLYNEYVNNRLSPADIYKKYNCKEYFNNSETLLHIFKDWKFPIRSRSAAVINEWLQGKLESIKDPIHYKQQWYTTWNGKDVYLHSSFELDYAKELDAQQIDYVVEYLRIKYWDTQRNEFRCAIPDFYIPSTNTIVEIKSNYTLDKQNMKDKMKAYLDLGYNFKLICDHQEIEL